MSGLALGSRGVLGFGLALGLALAERGGLGLGLALGLPGDRVVERDPWHRRLGLAARVDPAAAQ